MGNLISMFANAWARPRTAMDNIRAEGEEASIVPAMTFVVVMGLLAGVITAIWGFVAPPAGVPAGKTYALMSLVVVPIGSFIGSFLGAGIVWSLVAGLLRGNLGQYKASYRLIALMAA